MPLIHINRNTDPVQTVQIRLSHPQICYRIAHAKRQRVPILHAVVAIVPFPCRQNRLRNNRGKRIDFRAPSPAVPYMFRTVDNYTAYISPRSLTSYHIFLTYARQTEECKTLLGLYLSLRFGRFEGTYCPHTAQRCCQNPYPYTQYVVQQQHNAHKCRNLHSPCGEQGIILHAPPSSATIYVIALQPNAYGKLR